MSDEEYDELVDSLPAHKRNKALRGQLPDEAPTAFWSRGPIRRAIRWLWYGFLWLMGWTLHYVGGAIRWTGDWLVERSNIGRK